MINLSGILDYVNNPIGIGAFAGAVTMLYLILMSINSYLPPVLLLSLTVGYIVYRVQRNCGQCKITSQPYVGVPHNNTNWLELPTNNPTLVGLPTNNPTLVGLPPVKR